MPQQAGSCLVLLTSQPKTKAAPAIHTSFMPSPPGWKDTAAAPPGAVSGRSSARGTLRPLYPSSGMCARLRVRYDQGRLSADACLRSRLYFMSRPRQMPMAPSSSSGSSTR